MTEMRFRFLPFILLLLAFAVTAEATHDQGLGKSQDRKEAPNIATASEPLSAVLFGSGLGLLALGRWRRRAR